MTKPSSCIGCPLYDAPAVLHGDCGSNARIIYIGQNPGQQEISEQRPFVGPSGRTLNRQLFEAKLSRSNLYITNQVKCLTPGNRPPTSAEVAHCRPIIDAELSRLPAAAFDTVILAGETAFSANIGSYSTIPGYLPRAKFMSRIGCVEQRDGRKWIGTIHPAFVLRMPEFRDTAVEHLRKARLLSGISVPSPVLDPTDALADHAAAALRTNIFADDVETNNSGALPDSEEDYVPQSTWRLELVGFSAIPYHAVVIQPDATTAWHPVWNSPTTIQAEHNGEYDRFFLSQLHSQRNARFDTLLAFHYLYNNFPNKGLKPWAVSTFTNLPYYNRDLDRVNPSLYCALDNIATLLCANKQIPMLRDLGMLDVFLSIGMRMLPITSEWQRRGVRVDLSKVLDMIEFLVARERKLENELDALVPNINWNSPKQLQELFYTEWGLPQQRKRDKKTNEQRITTDDDARDRLAAWINKSAKRATEHATALAVFDTMGELKSTGKLLEYFTRLDRTSWKLHPYFKLHGTKFHRLSSAPNLQNLPKWSIDSKKEHDPTAIGSIRSIIVPDTPDDLFIDIDYAQMQLWIYAVQFNIKWLLDIYASGDYLYGRVYEELNKKPFFVEGAPKTKKNKGPWITEQELRKIKEIPLGFLFGLEAKSMADKNGWPLELTQYFRREYFARVPELSAAHSWIMDRAKQQGYVTPPPGVCIRFPNPSLDALNCFAQTPEAFKVQQDVILLEERFAALPFPARTVLTVHDSILMNIGGARSHPNRIRTAWHDVILPTLSRPTTFLNDFVFRLEANVGDTWDWRMTDIDQWIEQHCTN